MISENFVTRYHVAVDFLHEGPEKQMHKAVKGCWRHETFTKDGCLELAQDKYVCSKQQSCRDKAI